MASLSVVFTYAVKQLGWIKENPLFRFTKLKESKGRQRLLTRDECDRLLVSCQQSKNKNLHTIVILAIVTDMRQSEILGLTWDCLDMKSKFIRLKDTKNGRSRSVPLIDELYFSLKIFIRKSYPIKLLCFLANLALKKSQLEKPGMKLLCVQRYLNCTSTTSGMPSVHMPRRRKLTQPYLQRQQAIKL